MSKFLSAAASTQFDSEVLHEYQGMGSLRTTVTPPLTATTCATGTAACSGRANSPSINKNRYVINLYYKGQYIDDYIVS